MGQSRACIGVGGKAFDGLVSGSVYEGWNIIVVWGGRGLELKGSFA